VTASTAGFVWDPRLASHVYRPDHPLKPWRLQGVHDTLERLGAFALPNARLLAPRLATRGELERIHDPAYVDAIEQASADPELDYSAWGLSPWGDTPPFAGMHEASLLTTGASLSAMEEVLAGRARVAFNGAGGLHHAMRRSASGFCIYNDPAVVCGLLADRGMKVAYVDIDAHHGDGVQAAFYDTDQVLTISLHEFGMIPRLGRPFFPGTGTADERGTGKGAGYSVNVALPPYTDDLAYMRAFDAVVPPLLERFRPDVLVTQQGIDSHFTDPLTDLQLSTHAREHVVGWFASTPYPWIAMGGGGYDLDAVRRTWSMEYLIMLDAPVPEALHDDDPPVLGGRARTAVDVATDQATHEALAAAFK
jgi:acetoin utilization protein AcuC